MYHVLGHKRSIIIICVLAVIVRVIFSIFFIDLKKDDYWEYGEIAKNIKHGRGYALWWFDGEKMINSFNEAAQPHPSAFMPPGYVFYLLPFLSINNISARNFLIICGHIALSILLIVIVYNFTKIYFSAFSAVLASAFVAFLPEFIYATTTYTPTIFYHLIIMLLLTLLYNGQYRHDFKNLIAITLLMGLAVYLRSEFLLFAFFVIISFLVSGYLRQFFIAATLTVVLLAPWQLRNCATFRTMLAPLSTSFGLNFYRGHNPYFHGAWGDAEIDEQLKAHGAETHYEMKMNAIYTAHAIRSIKQQPWRQGAQSFAKILYLWGINPYEYQSRNGFYIIPWFVILVLFVVGIAKTYSWQNHQYAYLFFIYSTLIAVVFFVRLRHQTMMKIAMIPFAGYGAEMILQWLKVRRAARGKIAARRLGNTSNGSA